MSANGTTIDLFKKTTYSSTAAKYFIEYCPQALQYHLDGEPEDTSIFETGNTAHEILCALGRNKIVEATKFDSVADGVVMELCTNGYEYFGKKHPPFNPENALSGREIARKYFSENSLPLEGQFETVLAMDADGKPCQQEGARWRAKIDVLYEAVEFDEGAEHAAEVIAVDDYKTAWPAGEDELETLQRKSQMVLAWLHYPNKDGVRATVINLRTGKPYKKVIYFDAEGVAILERWKHEILMLCDEMDKTRAARPGVGCAKCPFVEKCQDARRIADEANTAASLAVYEGLREQMRKRLRLQLQDSAGVRCNGGFIGYHEVEMNVLSEQAIPQILGNWFEMPLATVENEMPLVKGLLLALGLGPSNIKNFIKTRFSGEHKVEKKEFLQLCLEKETEIEFGIWHKANEDLPDDLLPEQTVIAPLPKKKVNSKSKSSARKKSATASKEVVNQKRRKKPNVKKKAAKTIKRQATKKNKIYRKLVKNERKIRVVSRHKRVGAAARANSGYREREKKR